MKNIRLTKRQWWGKSWFRLMIKQYNKIKIKNMNKSMRIAKINIFIPKDNGKN